MATFLQSYSASKDVDSAQLVSRKLSHRSAFNLLFSCLLLFATVSAYAQRPLGVDVSGYQTNVNWASVKNAGIVFAWTKATEGAGYKSPYFTTQETGGTGVGIYMGAYHFARPSSHPNITGANSADTEAQYFWNAATNYVKFGGKYLVPMLDWEDPLLTTQLTAAQMSSWVNEWCLAVSNHAAAAGVVGVRPVIYTGTWYSQPSSTYVGLSKTAIVTNWPNWMSGYPSNPNPQTGSPSTYPWPSWKIWQYADTSVSGGDADVFNGNLAGFIQTFLVGGTNAPTISTPPASVTVGVGSNATFSVRASGPAPLTFQWYFNGNMISGATSSNYTIANVQLANAGGYSVSVSNFYASIPSSTVFLSVIGPQTNAPASAAAPANMVSWWPAEGNGIDIYSGNNLTPNNGLSYTSGKVGMAFHFDGSTGYLTPATTTSVSPNWTVCMWINRQNASGVSAALMGDSTYAIKLEQYNGTREVGITQSGVADYLFSPAYTVPVGTWTHLAFVGTSTTVTLYANGVSKGTITASSIPMPRGCIGADLLANGTPTDYMLGSLDEIQTFNRALSATEIANIYSAGAAGLVRAPQFTSVSSPNSGQIQLNLRGLTGKNINILTSTDLVTWVSLGAIANPTGTATYVGSTTNTWQFYRTSQ